jgi:hypothetical protein
MGSGMKVSQKQHKIITTKNEVASKSANYLFLFVFLARLEGFEPPTYGLEGPSVNNY